MGRDGTLLRQGPRADPRAAQHPRVRVAHRGLAGGRARRRRSTASTPGARGARRCVLLLAIAGVIVAFASATRSSPTAGKTLRYVVAGRARAARLGARADRGAGPRTDPAAPAGARAPPGRPAFLIRLVTIVARRHRRAADRRREARDPRGRRCLHRGRARPRRPADARPRLRRPGPAHHPPVPRRRPGQAPRRRRWRGRSRGSSASLGLFYTTLISGGDRTMIPNNVLMQLAVIPIAEPERVELRAKFNVSVTPAAPAADAREGRDDPPAQPARRAARGARRRRGHRA